MKKLWLTVLISALILSCSQNRMKSPKKEYGQRYTVKNKVKTLKYENQDDSFDDMFDSEGNYTGYYKVGSTYKIKGRSYAPKEYEKYEKVGIASWYGPNFHGKETANGEIYNSDSVTAAHKTLPLPSIVRVTNLENGKMIMVRVNDRGPFAKDRIIDLSKKSATLLGFKEKGTAKVKVELLPDETNELLAQLNIKK
jgi:rare lipoprotein A